MAPTLPWLAENDPKFAPNPVGAQLAPAAPLPKPKPRPDIAVPAVRVFTSSFPSGHAASSAITYLTLGALLARTHSSPAIRIYFMSVAVVLTLPVGLSRGEDAEPEFRSGWRGSRPCRACFETCPCSD